MVDIGRNDGVACRHFLADELGRDERFESERFDLLILADGYVFHLGCDDAPFGVEHLGDVFAFTGALREMLDRKVFFCCRVGLIAHVFGRVFLQMRQVFAASVPFCTDAWDARRHVDCHPGIGVGTGGVVQNDRIIAFSACRITVIADHDGVG